MAQKAFGPLRSAALILLANAAFAHAQPLPAQPVPVTSSTLKIEEPAGPPALSPPPLLNPRSPQPMYPNDDWGPHDFHQTAFPPPGWFAGFELALVGPHIKNRLVGVVDFGSLGQDVIHLPTAQLDWTGAPKFEVGYRLCDGFGAFQASFCFLTSDGHAVLPDFGYFNDGVLRSRLDMDVVDLDYASHERALGPNWDMQWKIGARLASVFFDSRALGDFVEERTSNHFFGAGPHAALDLSRTLVGTRLALFGRLDGAVVIGQIRQKFDESFSISTPMDTSACTEVRMTQAVPVLNAQAGLTYTPGDGYFRFTTGYQVEHWWYVGDAGDSRAELTVQGIFFRGEINY